MTEASPISFLESLVKERTQRKIVRLIGQDLDEERIIELLLSGEKGPE